MRRFGFATGCALVALLLLGLIFWRASARTGLSHFVSATAVRPDSDTPTKNAEPAGKAPSGDSDQKIKLGDITSVPLPELADVLAKKRSDEIAALARELDRGNTNINSSKVTALFKAWAMIDPRAAVDTAISFHDPALRATAISATIETVPPASAGTVAAALLHAPDDRSFARGALLTKTLIKWSQADPAAAANMLNSSEAESAWASASDGRPALVVVTEAFGTVAQNYASTDPAAALRWAASLHDRNRSEFANHGAVEAWWQTDPAAAANYALAHADDAAGQNMAATIAQSMAAEDPEKAQNWANQIQNPQARTHAQTGIAIGLARTDPARALGLAIALPPGEDQQTALTIAVHEWMMRDPNGAQAWIQQSTIADNEKKRLLSLGRRR